MLSIPEEVKTLFQTDNIKKNLRVSFPNNDHADLTNANIVKDSFSFTESLCSQTDIQLGLCEASVVTFETVGLGNVKGCKIKVDCEIDCSSLGSEWCEANASTSDDVDFPFYSVPYGIFYVDKCPKKSGATANHRTITAYTKEAYDDWTMPESVQEAIDTGWYVTLDKTIPVDVIRYASFPELCEGEFTYIKQPSAYSLIRNTTLSLRYKLKTDTKWTAYRSNYHAKVKAKTISGSNAILRIKASVGSDYSAFINECKKIVKANASNLGYEFENLDEYFQMFSEIKITSVGGNYHTYSYGSYSCLDKKKYSKYLGTEYDQAHYQYILSEGTEQASMHITRNRDSSLTVSVPCAIKITDLIPDIFAEGLTATFESTNSIFGYLQITEFSSRSIAYSLDQETKFYAIDSSSQTSTQLSGYYGELDIDIRDIIEAQAELEGKLGKFNRYGSFEYISLNGGASLYPNGDLYPSETLYPQEPSIIMHSSQYTEASWEDQYNKPYDRVSVDYKDADGNTIYAYIDLVDHEADDYNEDDYQSYTLGSNWFIKNQTFTEDEIMAILQDVADNVSNIRYMPSDVELRGMPYIEAGDYVEFLTKDNGFQTIVLRNTIEGEMFLTQSIESD